LLNQNVGKTLKVTAVTTLLQWLVDVSLVRRLLEAPFPRWSELAVRPIESSGWDNAIYRLGTDLAVRLPRRTIGAAHVGREHDWLPVLGPQLPLATPVPLGKGVAGEGYPWPWTVCPWLTGEVAAVSLAEDMTQAALRLAGFIAALQAIDSVGGRSCPSSYP
jgi:aminoglycoside phosphotransferase (APT) family kinase protein